MDQHIEALLRAVGLAPCVVAVGDGAVAELVTSLEVISSVEKIDND